MKKHVVHEVVVIGGGYAGAIAAVRAAGKGRQRVNVTLVDPRQELVQRLRLHQMAAGQTVRSYNLNRLTGREVTNVRGEAYEIDVDRSRVRVSGSDVRKELPFDSVILATGSTIDTASVPGAAEHAHSLAGPASAARLHLALRFLSKAAVVAVCGGGMTGMEAASEFAELRPDVSVKLLTADALGSWMSTVGREQLAARLGRLGVEVVEHARVTEVGHERLSLRDGATLRCDAAVWCGGFTAHPLASESGLATDRRGCLVVDAELRSVSHPQVLGAGDAAAIPTLPNGAAFRMTCQAGMPAGAHAADTVVVSLKGQQPEPFDLGYIHQPISLGRGDGVIQWVDRADRPKPKVLTGRRAAIYKELVTRGAVPSIAMERRMPGALRWPSGGNPLPEIAASPRAA